MGIEMLVTLVMAKPLRREDVWRTFGIYGSKWQGNLSQTGIKINQHMSTEPNYDIIKGYLALCNIPQDEPPEQLRQKLNFAVNGARGLLRFNPFLNETIYAMCFEGAIPSIEILRQQLLADKFMDVRPLNEETMGELAAELGQKPPLEIFDGTQSGFTKYFDRISEGMPQPIRDLVLHRLEFKPPIIYLP